MSTTGNDLFAYLDDDGTIVAVPMGSIQDYPLIAPDRARIDALRPYAQAIANAKQRAVRLVTFETRRDLDLVLPTMGRVQ